MPDLTSLYSLLILLLVLPKELLFVKGDDPSVEPGPNPTYDDDDDDGDDFKPNELSQLEKLFESASYYDECDYDLYMTHIVPIYKANILDEAWEAKVALHKYLLDNEELASKSCYGLDFDFEFGKVNETVENFMGCESCDVPSQPEKKFYCCKCLSTEPYIYHRQPHQTPLCKLDESLRHSPCDPERYLRAKDEIHDPFFLALRLATKRKDYVDALLNYAKGVDQLWFPPDYRYTCYTESNNMECDDDKEKCECINDGPHRQYRPHSDGFHCVGKKGSICHIHISVRGGETFERISACEEGLECTDAVPGLFCENYDNPDCVFIVPGPDNTTDTDDKDYVSLWGIRACGGAWADKPSLLDGALAVQSSWKIMTTLIFISLTFLTFDYTKF